MKTLFVSRSWKVVVVLMLLLGMVGAQRAAADGPGTSPSHYVANVVWDGGTPTGDGGVLYVGSAHTYQDGDNATQTLPEDMILSLTWNESAADSTESGDDIGYNVTQLLQGQPGCDGNDNQQAYLSFIVGPGIGQYIYEVYHVGEGAYYQFSRPWTCMARFCYGEALGQAVHTYVPWAGYLRGVGIGEWYFETTVCFQH